MLPDLVNAVLIGFAAGLGASSSALLVIWIAYRIDQARYERENY